MIIKMPYFESIYVVKEKLNYCFLSFFNKYSDGLVFFCLNFYQILIAFNDHQGNGFGVQAVIHLIKFKNTCK